MTAALAYTHSRFLRREGLMATTAPPVRFRGALLMLIASVVLAACAPSRPSLEGSRESESGLDRSLGPRGTLHLAWVAEPPGLNNKIISSGPAYITELSPVFNSALTRYDASGVPRPLLAQTIPSQDNGDLLINADGTVVTTYRLRQNAKWHDGTQFTAHDLVFSHQVYSDPQIPVNSRLSQDLVSEVEASDDFTFVVRWKRPYFRASTLTEREILPLPRHVLGQKAQSNKENFTAGDEWTAGYVSTGPFRVERWEPGIRIVARAQRDWFLGAPKLDSVVIAFLTDPNARLAQLLSGEMDYTMTPFVTPSAAVSIGREWESTQQGHFIASPDKLYYAAFQFREVPNWEKAVVDLRVRQAILHALDRDSLAEAMTSGLGFPAHAWVHPSDVIFADMERAVVKYPYDPRRAGALLAEAGWRLADGARSLRNSQGDTLNITVRTSAQATAEQMLAIIADNWRTVGVQTELSIIPPSRARDAEYRVSFPGVDVTPRAPNAESFVFTSDRVPSPQNGWQGANDGSFRDAEIDRLQDVVLTALRPEAWNAARIAQSRRMSELLGIATLYYEPRIVLAGPRVDARYVNPGSTNPLWNVYEWSLVE